MEITLPRDGEEFNIGKLKFIYKENMDTEEWLDTRRDGIGGSDIGVVMGVNPWMSPTRLWYEKLGLSEPKDLTENDSVFWGRMDEGNILNASQYYDPTDDKGYMRNFAHGNKIYSHVDFPFFAINEDIPWLRMNVDGLGYFDNSVSFEQVRDRVFEGEFLAPDKLVEIKTIKERATERWRGGIPYGYVYQVLGYLAVFLHTNPDMYGEIYSRFSGTTFKRNDVYFDEKEVEELLIETYEFWNTIEAAKEIMEEDDLTEEEVLAKLYQLEPSPDGSKDYADFLSEKELEKLAREKNKMAGNDELMDIALRYQDAKNDKAIAEAQVQRYGNILKSEMRKNNSSIIQFDEGRVSFNRRLYVNV